MALRLNGKSQLLRRQREIQKEEKAMDARQKDQADKILAAAQTQLEALGLKCIQSPTSLPQGYTLVLIVGESDLAIAGAHVALSVGGVAAHTAAADFDHQVSQVLADFAIIRAAR